MLFNHSLHTADLRASYVRDSTKNFIGIGDVLEDSSCLLGSNFANTPWLAT